MPADHPPFRRVEMPAAPPTAHPPSPPPTASPSSPHRPHPSRQHHPAQRARTAVAVGAAVTAVGLAGVLAVTTDAGAGPTSAVQDDTTINPALVPPVRAGDGDDDHFPWIGGDDDGDDSVVAPAVPALPSNRPTTRSSGS